MWTSSLFPRTSLSRPVLSCHVSVSRFVYALSQPLLPLVCADVVYVYALVMLVVFKLQIEISLKSSLRKLLQYRGGSQPLVTVSNAVQLQSCFTFNSLVPLYLYTNYVEAVGDCVPSRALHAGV